MFEDPPHLRRTPPIFDLRLRNEEPPSFDLRSRSTKNPPSSIFDFRHRRSKNPPSSIFSPEDRSEDRTEDEGGGSTSSKMGGVLRRCGVLRSSGSEGRRKNPPIFDLRGWKNEEPPLSSTFSAGRTKNPLFLLLPTPLPLRPILTRSSQLS